MAARPLFVVLALLGATLACPAQQVIAEASAVRGPILATKDGLSLPAGEFTVADLIDATSRYLCRNYLHDDGAIAVLAPFTLQRPLALDALGAEEVLYALLASRDLLVLPLDELRGMFAIVPLVGRDRPLPMTSVPMRTPDEILRRPRLHELVTTVVTLRAAEAPALANALSVQFTLQSGRAASQTTAAALDARTLLLHGFRDQLAEVLAVLRQLDRHAEAAATPADVLQRLDALEREVAALRRELAERPPAPR